MSTACKPLALIFIPLSLGLSTAAWSQAQSGEASEPVGEIIVQGNARLFSDASNFSPTSRLEAEELEAINFNTAEDAVAQESNVIVRQRFVGDPNGTLGMRGSNMFQTPRTMVFADGLPLHFHLQTRWNGSPRWSLVAPDEIEATNIIYGPFSAEYSGNAMGGVVNIETGMPEQETAQLETSLFQQSYDQLATDESLEGNRLFAGYGNKWGDLSVYGFYNRIRNESQPMEQFFNPASPATGEERQVTGGFAGVDEFGNEVIKFGDSGSNTATTDLFKLKTQYEFGEYRLRGTIAFEDRSSKQDGVNNFLRNENGDPVWDGTAALGGQRFEVGGRFGNPFSIQQVERESLLLGVGLDGPMGDTGWYVDSFVSRFGILDNTQTASSLNPRNPAFDGTGEVVDQEGTGWRTFDVKFTRDNFAGIEPLQLNIGYHYSSYELGVFAYDSDDFAAAEKTSLRSKSGGRTATQAAYIQSHWDLSRQWQMGLGLRAEWWESESGFVDDTLQPDRSDRALSPKFSLSYQINPDWRVRYSTARAVRFPIVKELFDNVDTLNTVQQANAGLEPEDGIHHNLGLQRPLRDGRISFNLFAETIDDVIFGQQGIVNNVQVNTFLPIDEVQTRGVEFIYNQRNLLDLPLDMRFNTSYTNTEIGKNRVNPSVEGNDMPRMPHWRSKLMLDYQVLPQLSIGGSIRAASNSFGELANNDRADNVFGAHDSYVFVDIKANWSLTERARLSLGMDNVSDELAFVHHPWPSRSLFMEFAYGF